MLNDSNIRQFRVISSTLLAPSDRSNILAALADFKTAGMARAKAANAGFAINTIDPQGRVLSLKWKGVEVALLYHREVSTVDVLPKDATPTMKVNATEDEWLVVNLIQPPYQDQISSLQNRICALQDNLARTQGMLEAKTHEADQANAQHHALSLQIAALKEDNDNYKIAFQQHKATGQGILVKYKTRPVPKDESDRNAKRVRIVSNVKPQPKAKPVPKAKKKPVSKGRP